MSDPGRKLVLERIGDALGDAGRRPGVADALDSVLEAPPGHSRPGPGDFIQRLEQNDASWEQVNGPEDILAAVRRYCRQQGITQLVTAAGLAEMPWPAELTGGGPVAPAHSLAVCRARLGVAETGSLLLCNRERARAALHVLAEHLVVVLPDTHIVPHLEDVWAALRDHGAPWSASLVSGPSRTADVEQTLQNGAHGPRRVHVLMDQGSGL